MTAVVPIELSDQKTIGRHPFGPELRRSPPSLSRSLCFSSATISKRLRTPRHTAVIDYPETQFVVSPAGDIEISFSVEILFPFIVHLPPLFGAG